MKNIALLVVLAGSNCGYPPLPLDASKLVPAPDGAMEAMTIVCADYGISECPPVFFYGPESMNCLDGTGWIEPSVGNECIAGLRGSDGILLGLSANNLRPNEYPLTHELMHWRSDDDNHTSIRIWGKGGWNNWHVRGSIVGDESFKLAAMGL